MLNWIVSVSQQYLKLFKYAQTNELWLVWNDTPKLLVYKLNIYFVCFYFMAYQPL